MNSDCNFNIFNVIHFVNSFLPFQLVFEAVRGTGYKGDIAIDDISTYSFDCNPPPITTSAPTTGQVGSPGVPTTTQGELFTDVY